MELKSRQEGFLITKKGELTLRRTKGSLEIKKKVKTPKVRKITPFEEVQHYERIHRERARILEEYHAHEDADGGLHIEQNGAMSHVSPDEHAEFIRDVSMKRPELPEIPVLSEKAKALRFRLDRQKSERGPLQAPKLPGAGNVDAFGNPLKSR